MRIRQLASVAPLQPFIDRIWGWQADAGEVVALPTLLPGTGAELYIHHGQPFRCHVGEAGGGRVAQSHLSCLRRETVALAPTPDIGFIAVRFRAGMLSRFGVRERDVIDGAPSAEDLWGAAGRALLRTAGEHATFDNKAALVQDFLLGLLRGRADDPLIEQAMAMLYRRSVAISVADMSKALDLGPRQLERRFRQVCGLTAAEFRGLSRFQHTVRRATLAATDSPGGIALGRGYYDQSHFIHDFHRRVGRPPRAYFAEARTRTHFYNPSRSLVDMP